MNKVEVLSMGMFILCMGLIITVIYLGLKDREE